jgi:hypothetical protein
MLGDKEDRKGQIIKTHFGLKCEALVLILPPKEYKRRTDDDDTFVLNVRHLALPAMLRGGQIINPWISLLTTQAG